MRNACEMPTYVEGGNDAVNRASHKIVHINAEYEVYTRCQEQPWQRVNANYRQVELTHPCRSGKARGLTMDG